MIVIISGSSKIEDSAFVEKHMMDILSKEQYELEIPKLEFSIFSGHDTKGAEYFAEKWARKNGIELTFFPANWNNLDASVETVVEKQGFYGKYNSLAGFNRNDRMLGKAMRSYPDVICIAFDDGSTGTKDLVKKCKQAGVKTYQIYCKNLERLRIKVWN